MGDSIRTALEQLVEALDDYELCWNFPESALDTARAALAEQQGEGLSDEELLQIAGHAACIEDLQECWEEMIPVELTATEILSICRAILARRGHPAPALNQVFAGPTTETDVNAPHFRFLTADDLPKSQGEGPRLCWTENLPPSKSCSYDHCIAETPFGRFLITWKSWKEYDSPTVEETPWGDWYDAFNSIDEAKAACQREFDQRLARCGRAALATAVDGPAVPASREPASVVGESIDDAELDELFTEIDQSGEPLSWRAYARAVLARWGHQPAPPAEGEMGELVNMLTGIAYWKRHGKPGQGDPSPFDIRQADRLTRAAELLQQQEAELQECRKVAAALPEALRYEFSVYDADYVEQAGGSAPTYAQALSEGQRYLAQYQQDGPHTLELRRVEVLNPGPLPLPHEEVK